MSVKQQIPQLTQEQIGSIPKEARQEVECWTRVMGYYRPISQFNVGKKQENKDRINFKEPKLT